MAKVPDRYQADRQTDRETRSLSRRLAGRATAHCPGLLGRTRQAPGCASSHSGGAPPPPRQRWQRMVHSLCQGATPSSSTLPCARPSERGPTSSEWSGGLPEACLRLA
eukprot:scaffold108850_cov60-Phaeocystis_antarctica.AAC.4